LLSLLLGPLLVRSGLLPHLEAILATSSLRHFNPLHRVADALSSHVENWSSLRWVVDDDVVDVVVVDDVRDVPSSRLGLRAFLRVTRGRSAASHPESLTVRRPCSLETSFVFTRLRHGVLCEFLRPTEWPFLIVPVAADEVVILLEVHTAPWILLLRLLGIVRAENTALAVS